MFLSAIIFILKIRKDDIMSKAKKLPSGSWRCQVYSHTEEIPQPDGSIKKKRIYKSFTCNDTSARGKRICEAEAAAWAKNKETQETFNTNMLFEVALDSYIASKEHVLAESTITGYKTIKRNYMKDILHIPLRDFNKANVQQWVNNISQKTSPKTVKNAYGLFSAVVSMFTDYHFKTKMPQKKQEKFYIPSDADVKTLIEHAEGDFKLALYLAAFGGLRRGEICALDRSDVFDGYISITKSMGMTQERTWTIKPPKTESSNRNVNLPDFLIQILKSKKGQLIEMSPDNITDKFCKLRDKLGMKNFRFHDLRHYYVSVNHALGIPDQYIMAMGGWSTDRTMKAVYRNTLAPEQDKFTKLSLSHFESMQHEMQHKNK